MKNLFLFAFALCLSFSLSAQVASESYVDITNESTENKVDVYQFSLGGLVSNVDIDQESDGNNVDIYQWGENDVSDVLILNQSDYNKVSVVQDDTDFDFGDNYSSVYIDNSSDENKVEVTQQYGLNTSFVTLDNNSDNNKVTVWQDDLAVAFVGDNISGVFVDDSDDNKVTIDQQEDQNKSYVSITAGSDGNVVNVGQALTYLTGNDGFDNLSDVVINDDSERNRVNVLQDGAFNISSASIDEDSDENRVSVGQADGNQYSEVSIFYRSDNNKVEVSQSDSYGTGVGNESYVTIGDDADNNKVFVTQDFLGLSIVNITTDSDANTVNVIQE